LAGTGAFLSKVGVGDGAPMLGAFVANVSANMAPPLPKYNPMTSPRQQQHNANTAATPTTINPVGLERGGWS